MTATCGSMLDELAGNLTGWSVDEEQATTLAADIGPTDTSFTVTTSRGVATGISPGTVEIGLELMYVDTVTGQQATVVPWGRGYRSTVATAHTAGTRIVSQPTFPRAKLLDALNESLLRVFPTVFAVKSYETTSTVPVLTYDLPDDAQRVLRAVWQQPDGSKYWRAINRWRISPGGGTRFGDGLNGITIDVADPIPAGRPMQFLYAAKPTQFSTEADGFAAVTGLPESMKDVVILGAMTGSVISQELSRLQMATIEQQNRSQTVAPSAALTSSRYLEQRYQLRLAEEQMAQRQLYPPKVTGVWK